MMLDNSDRLTAQIAALDARIEEAIGPFSRQAARLVDIPGVNTVAAAELVAEVGADMTPFPTAAHLVSWAKTLPPDPPVRQQVDQQRPRQGQPMAGRRPRSHRLRQFSRRHLPRCPLPAPGAAARQAKGHRRHRQLGTDRRLPPAVRSRRQILRPRTGVLRIPHQQTPPRPRSRQPTPNAHRPAHRHPRRQSRHRRHRCLTKTTPAQHHPAPPRVPSACSLTIRFSGQSALMA